MEVNSVIKLAENHGDVLIKLQWKIEFGAPETKVCSNILSKQFYPLLTVLDLDLISCHNISTLNTLLLAFSEL